MRKAMAARENIHFKTLPPRTEEVAQSPAPTLGSS